MTHSTAFPCFSYKGSWHTLQPSLIYHTRNHDTIYSLPLFITQRIMTHSIAFSCFSYKGSWHTLQPSLVYHTKNHDTLYSLPLFLIQRIMTPATAFLVYHKKNHDTFYSLPLFLIQRIILHFAALPCFPYEGSRHTLQPCHASNTNGHDIFSYQFLCWKK